MKLIKVSSTLRDFLEIKFEGLFSSHFGLINPFSFSVYIIESPVCSCKLFCVYKRCNRCSMCRGIKCRIRSRPNTVKPDTYYRGLWAAIGNYFSDEEAEDEDEILNNVQTTSLLNGSL